MTKPGDISLRDLGLPPNILSLVRIALTPAVGYFLWRGDQSGTVICFVLLVVAGLTDLFDGMLARKLNQVTPLGKILDPIADKIFTIVLIIELVFFRDFPVWMASAIIGRDLLILALGGSLLRGKKVDVQSNLTGKYYFCAVVTLLAVYLIRFPFGQMYMLYVTSALLVLSTINYGYVFGHVLKRGETPVFIDRKIFVFMRVTATTAISLILLYRLYTDMIL
ncbi:MAG: CDP-alcohol phosphatidyltransferase family protein [candidate division Zixibacteria bacterium]|nr:CDP-alcohol phosphatidyltransferase family protein [candidate division Zixibacteria bacterium]